jgi:hypothetical protein
VLPTVAALRHFGRQEAMLDAVKVRRRASALGCRPRECLHITEQARVGLACESEHASASINNPIAVMKVLRIPALREAIAARARSDSSGKGMR